MGSVIVNQLDESNEIHRRLGGRVNGSGGGGVRSLRVWNFVSATLKYVASGREKGNALLTRR